MNKIIIIDGNSLLFRAFYATFNTNKEILMHTKDNVPTNAIFAFSNMITSLLNTLNKDDAIFVGFDKGKHTFRHQKFKEYKANRIKTPEELLIQMPIAREFLTSINVKYLEDDNLEADDICGIVAKEAEKQGYKVLIYTSDKDYLQLINDNITIKLIRKGLKDIVDMTPTTFKDNYGFDPIQILDYKGLRGDSSDNLKGIPGIGDKTATNLIINYGSLENILEHKDEQSKKIKENLTEYAELGLTCKELAKLCLDYPLKFDLKEFVYRGYKFNNINEFSNHYEFKNLVNKLPMKFRLSEESALKNLQIQKVNDIPSLFPKDIGISIDFPKGNYHYSNIYGIAVSFEENTYYIEAKNIKKATNLLNLLKDENIKKYCFDFKATKYLLNNIEIELNGPFFDILLATYLLQSSIKNDPIDVFSYYNLDFSPFLNKEILLFEVGNVNLSSYISYYSLNLYPQIKESLISQNQYDLLTEIELPLANCLEEMEKEGFPISIQDLAYFRDYFFNLMEEAKRNVYRYAGHDFNINSTKELSNVLYNELKLKDNKKHSTSVEYLNELKDTHPIINQILEYRKYSKLISTYIDGIIPHIGEDRKIHATFNQTQTQTGRLSSSEPNLQNISVRNEDTKMIRKCFYYEDPSLNILSLDYSQIELRVLASLSTCKAMIDVFNSDEDIHSTTAKLIFSLNREPTDEERRKAKAVNFGIVYGISDYGLSEQLSISFSEAKEIIKAFNNKFPEIKAYLNNVVEETKQKGYSTTIFNRRRYFPEFNSTNYALREFAKRAAMNAPIQGSAADIIKIATIKVNKILKENNFKAKIINQIHDELILKVSDDEKDKVLEIVKKTMENCVNLKVKLKVNGGYAKTWFDAK